MIVLSRLVDQGVIVGEKVIVTVIDIRGEKVRLGFDGPTDVSIHRMEIWDAVQREVERLASQRQLKVTTNGPDKLGLASICQKFVDEQKIADNVPPEKAAAVVLESFRKAVAGALQQLEVSN